MSVTLNNIIGSDTFDSWRSRTNDLIEVSAKSVTMSGDANVGDILLTGDFTFQSELNVLKVSKIQKTSGGTFLSLNSDTKISGLLTVDTGDSSADIVLSKSGSDKWKIKTNSTHSKLMIEDVVNAEYLQIENGIIDSVGLELSEGVLPATLTRRIAHTGTGASGSSFSDVDIGAGNISPTKLTASGTSTNRTVIAEADINSGTIDGATIGATTASTGKFTTVDASTYIKAPHFRGDIAQEDGTVILDVSSASFAGEANAISAFAINQVIEKIYPIGSLYTSTTTTNPYTILGVGSSNDSWIPYCEGASPIGYQHWNDITNSRDYGDYHTEVYVGGSDAEGVKDSSKIAQHDIIEVTGYNMGNGTYTVLSKSGDWIRISRPQSLGHQFYTPPGRKIKNSYAKTLGEYQGQQGITLTTAQMPKHRHQLGIPRDQYGAGNFYTLNSTKQSDESVKFEHYSDYQGDNERINIVGKVQTIYIWKRIS